jgi:hypothetical protein
MTYTSINSVIPRGKAILVALAASLAVAGPALADQPPALAGQPTKSVCIKADEVDHTKVLNDRQVLFYMRGRQIWLNTLKSRCSTLPIQEGFSMPSNYSEFCANAQTIRVLFTGQPCQLGEFTPYQKPVAPS